MQIRGLRKWLNWFFGLLLLLVLFFSFYLNSQKNKSNTELQALIDTIEITHKEINVSKIENQNLHKALFTKEKENKELLELIKSLNTKPENIKYIVKTETKLIPSEPIFITSDIPKEYLFKMQNGLVTGRFAYTDEFIFESYELDLKTDLIIANNKTSALTKIKSSYDNQWLGTPMQLSVTNVTPKQNILEPQIAVGVTLDNKLKPNISLISSNIHYKDFDFVNLRFSYGNGASVGLDPISYNIGKPLPILTNAWLAPGVNLNTNDQVNYSLTLSAKL